MEDEPTCPECGEEAEWAKCVSCNGESTTCLVCNGDGGFYYCPYGCDEHLSKGITYENSDFRKEAK